MAKSHKTCMEQAEIIDTFGAYQQPLCTRWEQSYLLLCAGPRQLPSLNKFLAPLAPSCISWSPTGSITLVSSPRENLLVHYISPSTWGDQRGVRELSSSPYQTA